jgi:hypothetical protein
MSEPMDPKFLDKRTRDRYLQKGALDDKALDRFLKSLPDVADKAAPVETLMGVEGYDDEEDDEGDDASEEDSESSEGR